MTGLVKDAETRRTQTPNATMTTHASPTLGGSASLSMWTVEMSAGPRGPLHVFDSEQLWTVLSGRVGIDVDGRAYSLSTGDTAVLAAGAQRQITAETDARLMVAGHGSAIVTVVGEDAPRGTPA